jgi:PHD/YefM family antitoxin component YafN of YafNO toxin-antitoxin module
MAAAKDPVRVGVREFRENLASYLLQSDSPVVVTRNGDTVGYFIPARRGRVESERIALKQAAARLHKMLVAENLSEDKIAQDFSKWRAGKRK